MFVIGIWTVASCKVDNVSTVLITMGSVMSIFAVGYIALGVYASKGVEFSQFSYWPITAIAVIFQCSLQTWASKYNLLPPFTQYCPFNYDDECLDNFCPFWPIRSAIFILTIDVVYSLFCFLKMFGSLLKMFVTIPYRHFLDEISKGFSQCLQCFKNPNVQTVPGWKMSDNPDDELALIDNTDQNNIDSENEKNDEHHTE